MNRRLFDSAFSRMFVGLIVISATAIVVIALLTFAVVATTAIDNFAESWLPGMTVLTIFLLALLASAWYVARILAEPISHLGRGASRLGVDIHSPPMNESGSREARQATRVLNHLQQRILRHLEERSRFFAAISHDLRTPLTRCRLRINRMAASASRDRLLDEVDRLAALIDDTLADLREAHGNDPVAVTDLVALTMALVDDMAEKGAAIGFSGNAKPLPVRGPALRHCLRILMSNAVHTHLRCNVRLTDSLESVEFRLEDIGPRMPESQLMAILESINQPTGAPWETGRLESALAVANDIVRSHRGSLALRNRPSGGLAAIVTLPRLDHA